MYDTIKIYHSLLSPVGKVARRVLTSRDDRGRSPPRKVGNVKRDSRILYGVFFYSLRKQILSANKFSTPKTNSLYKIDFNDL